MTFSTKYLAEAIALLGIAWAVIRWIGRSLLEISGGSSEAEGHRFLERLRRRPRAVSGESTVADGLARDMDHGRVLDVTFRELRADGPIAERAASMSEPERQAIYDDLAQRLEVGGVSDAERAFALTVAMERLGLRGGTKR